MPETVSDTVADFQESPVPNSFDLYGRSPCLKHAIRLLLTPSQTSRISNISQFRLPWSLPESKALVFNCPHDAIPDFMGSPLQNKFNQCRLLWTHKVNASVSGALVDTKEAPVPNKIRQISAQVVTL